MISRRSNSQDAQGRFNSTLLKQIFNEELVSIFYLKKYNLLMYNDVLPSISSGDFKMLMVELIDDSNGQISNLKEIIKSLGCELPDSTPREAKLAMMKNYIKTLDLPKSKFGFDIQILHHIFLIKSLTITSLELITKLDISIGYKFDLLNEMSEVAIGYKNEFAKIYHDQLLLAS